MQQLNDNFIVLLVLGTFGMVMLAVSIVLFQIRNQNRTLRQQEVARRAEVEHQKQLLRTTITSQENERKRIGQDLHDDIGAALSGLRLSISMYEPTTDSVQYQRGAQQWTEQIDNIIQELRHIAHHLSPSLLTLHGLSAALEKQLTYINSTAGIQVHFNNSRPEILNVLPIESATALYRVLEELINNTIKHAMATLIEISITFQDPYLHIQYSDNGVGLSPSFSKGMGMHNIEARLSCHGATSQLVSDAGFHIEIKFPLTNQISSYDRNPPGYSRRPSIV